MGFFAPAIDEFDEGLPVVTAIVIRTPFPGGVLVGADDRAIPFDVPLLRDLDLGRAPNIWRSVGRSFGALIRSAEKAAALP